MLNFEAVIFDMDGVITRTAAVHSRAWKRMFDEYLRHRERVNGEPFGEFTHARDYLKYVDGRPRYKGVQAFLESRGIQIPWGTPDDPPRTETVCGLGNRKNELFNRVLEEEGVEVFDASVGLIRELLQQGIRVGVATSSRNCLPILERAGLTDLFEVRVDGEVSSKLGLKGKPAPDIFVTACDQLGVACTQAIVVEDAVSGVQAGASGGFALVIGIARENNAQELLAHGADIIVTDLREMSVGRINECVAAKGSATEPSVVDPSTCHPT